MFGAGEGVQGLIVDSARFVACELERPAEGPEKFSSIWVY